ncbi:hypothetical protein [Porcipelethomonas sp.]|uniref:hypothetical protein n=1 Tax=Porcipelethomonas sp. TaxID=2981675 RepID=UPI003EF497D4
MSKRKRKYKRKKALSAKEQARRRILREKRKERKKRENRFFWVQIWGGIGLVAVAFVLLIIFCIVSAKTDTNAVGVYIVAADILFISFNDKSGIRSFVFRRYPDNFIFAEYLKSCDKKRAFPMEIANTVGCYSSVLSLIWHKLSAFWTVIWIICIIVGFYYIITDTDFKYTFNKTSDYMDSSLFLMFTPLYMGLFHLENIDFNKKIAVFTIAICAVITGLFLLFSSSYNEKTSLIFDTMLFSALCGAAVFLSVNQNMDFSQPQVHTTEIADKNYVSGKYSSYGISFTDWNDSQAMINIHIDSVSYNQLEIGDSVVIEEYKGALGMKYYKFIGKAESDF